LTNQNKKSQSSLYNLSLNKNHKSVIDTLNIIIRIDYNAFWCYTMKLNCVPTNTYTIEHNVMCFCA